MRRQRNGAIDDADMAAGRVADTAPSTASSTNSLALSVGGFTDDSSTPSVLVLGVDVSHLSRRNQFIVTASGVFWFSLLYGYLQELISVQLCRRQLGLFLAMIQFAGYTILSWWLRNLVNRKQKAEKSSHLVPTSTYVGLSVLRGAHSYPSQFDTYLSLTLLYSYFNNSYRSWNDQCSNAIYQLSCENAHEVESDCLHNAIWSLLWKEVWARRLCNCGGYGCRASFVYAR